MNVLDPATGLDGVFYLAESEKKVKESEKGGGRKLEKREREEGGQQIRIGVGDRCLPS